jgi:ribosomal protein L37E
MVDPRTTTQKPASQPKTRRDDGLDCEICGARMYERSCKIACRNCGFTRDCSDP